MAPPYMNSRLEGHEEPTARSLLADKLLATPALQPLQGPCNLFTICGCGKLTRLKPQRRPNGGHCVARPWTQAARDLRRQLASWCVRGQHLPRCGKRQSRPTLASAADWRTTRGPKQIATLDMGQAVLPGWACGIAWQTELRFRNARRQAGRTG